jgi:hypothetical protein
MAGKADLLEALDAFVAEPKRIIGSEASYTWSPGYSALERQVDFPLEYRGEGDKAARLTLVGFPAATEMKFRISLCYNAAICRLDYTDETHPNSRRLFTDNLPSLVTGPHFHSWEINRRFFKGASTVPRLDLAEPFTVAGGFDSLLRWFCSRTNIEQPPSGHYISLPKRETLL